MTVTNATATAPRTEVGGPSKLVGWILGAFAVAAALAALAIAVWPASEADKARADGERLGVAVTDLYYADSEAEAEDALVGIDKAIADAREHGGDAVATQVAAQGDALSRAADGFVGSITAESDWDSELYQVELEYALDDLAAQTSDFRAGAPEVNQAYWEGVEEGLGVE